MLLFNLLSHLHLLCFISDVCVLILDWIYCPECLDAPVKYVLKYCGNGCQSVGKRDKGYLRVFSGARYARDRGLGFSLEAAPSWDADALFRMDKAGPWPSQDAWEQGLKEKRDGDKITWWYLMLLDIMAGNPIYYRRLYIVIDKQ